jgi:hypothetical protein
MPTRSGSRLGVERANRVDLGLSFDLGWRVGRILRLVRTGADNGGHSTDVMEINKPEDLGDIAISV